MSCRYWSRKVIDDLVLSHIVLVYIGCCTNWIKLEQVEVQEAYGKQTSQRYPLDPPDPKMLVGEDASTHNRGMGGPLPKLPLSVQPGEVHVQVWTISTPLHHLMTLSGC